MELKTFNYQDCLLCQNPNSLNLYILLKICTTLHCCIAECIARSKNSQPANKALKRALRERERAQFAFSMIKTLACFSCREKHMEMGVERSKMAKVSSRGTAKTVTTARG